MVAVRKELKHKDQAFLKWGWFQVQLTENQMLWAARSKDERAPDAWGAQGKRQLNTCVWRSVSGVHVWIRPRNRPHWVCNVCLCQVPDRDKLP